MMKKQIPRLGLMLLIIAIIFILAAFAVPNFLRSRKNSCMEACIANMRQLEGAREQALLAGAPAITSPILSPRPAVPLVPLMGHNTDIVITNKVSQ